MEKVYEVNFDGLIGPTHNFSGLATGNMASMANQFSVSHPQSAALEGLSKMKVLYDMGMKQGFIPPQTRPNIDILRQNGYEGSDEEVILNVANDNLYLLLMASSASSMWVANAATVTPSMDSGDHKVHLTPANLISHNHRMYESNQTFEFLKQIFSSAQFVIHSPIQNSDMPDEGAANHMRFCDTHGSKGIHVFVYGIDADEKIETTIHDPRQSYKAFEQIVQNHKLHADQVVYVKQNPKVIDQGVFHNDVIAMSNENVFIFHEQAYCQREQFIKELTYKFDKVSDRPLFLISISDQQLSVGEAVETYLFNSQIVTKADGTMTLIAPAESESSKARKVIDDIIGMDNPINEVKFVNLSQSMLNGGGPACLRLRVLLTESEYMLVNRGFILNDSKIEKLEEWIKGNYRKKLSLDDLKSITLYLDSMNTLNQLIPIISE